MPGKIAVVTCGLFTFLFFSSPPISVASITLNSDRDYRPAPEKVSPRAAPSRLRLAQFDFPRRPGSGNVTVPQGSSLEGQVVSEEGQPVANAHVLAPDVSPDASVLTDASGHFKLDSLPAGDLTIVAIHKLGASTTTQKSGTNDVKITLQDVEPVVQADKDRAYEILSDALEAGQHDNKWPAALISGIALNLVPYDFDFAFGLIRGKSKVVLDDAMIRSLIESMAEQDPKRASQLAPSQLVRINHPYIRLAATVSLALAVCDTEPEQAEQLYQEAKTLNMDTERAVMLGAARMASLAAHLHHPEAATLADKAITALKTLSPTDRLYQNSIVNLTEILAEGSEQFVEKAIVEIPTDRAASDWQKLSPYRVAIERLAKYDPEGALRLLDKLQKVPNPQADWAFGQEAYFVAKALATTTPNHTAEPQQAIALARRVNNEIDRAAALEVASRALPKREALALLRETFQSVSRPDISTLRAMSRIARQAYFLDPATGTELYQVLHDRLKSRLLAASRGLEPQRRWRQIDGAREVGEFAIGYCLVDPAESRLLVEEEWAYQKSLIDKNSSGIASFMWPVAFLVTAMTVLDSDRAIEMSWKVMPPDNMWYFPALLQHRIGAILLNPTAPNEQFFPMW